MKSWMRHRSVPSGALFASAVAILSCAVAAVTLYLAVIRPALGLPLGSAGVATAMLARPPVGIAAYRIVLRGPEDRRTPSGRAAVAYRWRIVTAGRDSVRVCEAAAADGVLGHDGERSVRISTAAIERALDRGEDGPVPPRLVASCGEAARHAGSSLRYVESIFPAGASVLAVACVRTVDGVREIGDCDDGTLAALYLHSGHDKRRVLLRSLLWRLLGCAGTYALVCFAAGIVALRRFDRTREPSA